LQRDGPGAARPVNDFEGVPDCEMCA